jgi:hypothetical protein
VVVPRLGCGPHEVLQQVLRRCVERAVIADARAGKAFNMHIIGLYGLSAGAPPPPVVTQKGDHQAKGQRSKDPRLANFLAFVGPAVALRLFLDPPAIP